MGQAMGSRTSATEASNAFQASMSAVTTDVDMLSGDIHGQYAQRVWDYTANWMDPDILQHITGQFGFVMTPEDMWTSIGIVTNVGSTYVEKIVKQQNIRYILESSRGEPGLNRAELWKELLDFMGFDGGSIVQDGGMEQQIQFANLQACQTYLGYPVIVDPDQDHQIAIKVKTAYIKDRGSYWNTTPDFARYAPLLIQQIQQHQYLLQLQMQQQLIQQQMAVAQAQLKVHQDNPPQMKVPGPNDTPARGSGPVPQTAGQVAQQGPGAQ